MAKGTTLNRPALIAALAVTALVLLLERLGSLASLEGALLDALFTYGRSAPRPISDRIVLVGIDDSSIEDVGRWPWPRSLQAKGIDEIRRAGAAVVAFDILYDAPSFAPDEDEALALAIERCQGVVGANSDPIDFVDGAWVNADQSTALGRLLALLGESAALPTEAAIREASLDDKWSRRFTETPTRFRELAAWIRLGALRSAGTLPGSFEDFTRAIGIPDDFSGAAARIVAQRIWERDRAWQALAKWMPPASGPPSPKETPPILTIARRAGGVGMVFGEPDSDGQMRRVHPFITTPGGDCLQLGIAAAARFMQVDPQRVSVSSERVQVGDRGVPLLDGMIVVDWPTAMFTDRSALRGGGERRPAIPFGTLVRVAQIRDAAERNEAAWQALVPELAPLVQLPEESLRTLPLSTELRAKVLDEIDFFLGDDEAATTADGLDPTLEVPAEGKSDEESEEARGLYIARLLRAARELMDLIPTRREELAAAEAVQRQLLEGRIVFIGFVATAIAADQINSPFGYRTPGVYVHAAVANMALEGRGLRFAPAWSEPLATLLLGILSALAAARMTAGRGALASLGALVVYAAVAWTLFAPASLVIPMAGPIIGGFASWVAGVALVAVISQRERAKIIRQFRARVSSELVERLTGDPDALSVRGAEREITVLFGDLAGFTTLSEQLGGPQVVSTLNRYMGALTRGLTARRAYVNKFLGDGLLAFWSAFGAEPDQCSLAIESAGVCQQEVAQLGESPEFRERPRIRLRLGIATGRAVVGDCGAPPDLNDYTAIGDVVNLASRLESANKQFGTSVLIDGRTASAAGGSAKGSLLRLGRVVVVGQSVPVEIFTMVDPDFPETARCAVTAAVEVFERGERREAIAAWQEVERAGAPSMAKPFLAALADEEEPCDGVLRLRAK